MGDTMRRGFKPSYFIVPAAAEARVHQTLSTKTSNRLIQAASFYIKHIISYKGSCTIFISFFLPWMGFSLCFNLFLSL